MALAALAVGGALVYNARRKRSAQIADLEDGASYLPSTQPEAETKLYDPLRRGPRWATDWLANRALHFRKRWPQPYVRPPYDNGQTRVLVRGTVGPEAAQRMQAVYADTLPEGPVFFTRKTTSFDRQIQPFVMPSYHPGTGLGFDAISLSQVSPSWTTPRRSSTACRCRSISRRTLSRKSFCLCFAAPRAPPPSHGRRSSTSTAASTVRWLRPPVPLLRPLPRLGRPPCRTRGCRTPRLRRLRLRVRLESAPRPPHLPRRELPRRARCKVENARV
jgi:hypothetical protein